jgi:hypothetical protein
LAVCTAAFPQRKWPAERASSNRPEIKSPMSDITEQAAPRNNAGAENSQHVRYRRKRQPMTAETRERIRAKLAAHYADPANREAAQKRMRRPGIRERIAERTAAALARPEVKIRHLAGLQTAWRDPDKRAAQAALTAERMTAWRARKLAEVAVVMAQMPKGERAAAVAVLVRAAGMGANNVG